MEAPHRLNLGDAAPDRRQAGSGTTKADVTSGEPHPNLFEGRSRAYRAAPGEFIDEWQWSHEDDLVWETDFRAHGDRDAWGWVPVEDGEADAFDAKVRAMSDELKQSRRWG